ncbi:MAG: AraC family transcriptional regulator [Lachnospiraceae bacterium]|nr:AraC family transcriptional regulator [Lachnospiraceae bacterium]
MIEELHGTKEIVHHIHFEGFRIHMNVEPEDYPAHWHSDIEIIMPLKNTYNVFIDQKNYTLNEGDIIIIPSGEMHTLTAPPTGERLIFQVEHSILREVNGFDAAYSRFFPCAVFLKNEENDEYQKLRSLLHKIIREQQEMDILCGASIHALTLSFFVEAGRICLKQNSGATVSKHQRQQSYIDTFFSICKYINEHCSEDLSLDTVVDISGFSKSHFIRLFKDFTGVTYYEYLQKRRMTNAELLLIDTGESVADIAMRSGYNSLATFNRVFKESHNCTPTEYRKAAWANTAHKKDDVHPEEHSA